MKDYEIIYRNLFYKVDEPHKKIFEVLIKMNSKFIDLDVIVDMYKDKKVDKWSIYGNDKFEKLNNDEVSEFISKLKFSEDYYMSGDDYEIIDVVCIKTSKGHELSVAVAHDGGHLSAVNIKMNNGEPVVFDTDWEYIKNSKDNLLKFIEDIQEFTANKNI